VALATMQALAHYWGTDYDWRKCEAKLNALPHFMTEIDGLEIHFINVRSHHEDALPLVVTHGWPGSIIEQLKIIEPLTNPRHTAQARRTRSISWCRRCRATGFPPSRPRPGGTRPASRVPGSC
jgi:Epoxide hydrolase N terminus